MNNKNLLDIRDVGFRVGDNTILQHVDFVSLRANLN